MLTWRRLIDIDGSFLDAQRAEEGQQKSLNVRGERLLLGELPEHIQYICNMYSENSRGEGGERGGASKSNSEGFKNAPRRSVSEIYRRLIEQWIYYVQVVE